VARHAARARALRAGPRSGRGRRSDGGDAPTSCWLRRATSPTQETVAAAAWLRDNAPELRVRVVNVVDLMRCSAARAPARDERERFSSCSPDDCHVVFAFHGYAGAVHQLIHGRADAAAFTSAVSRRRAPRRRPFDMVVLNEISRYHLVVEALRRARRPLARAAALVEQCREALQQHSAYVREQLDDLPEIREWSCLLARAGTPQ
jgi:xylulose-5-phosphate/fructose-6-phosphate phosphoketolase